MFESHSRFIPKQCTLATEKLQTGLISAIFNSNKSRFCTQQILPFAYWVLISLCSHSFIPFSLNCKESVAENCLIYIGQRFQMTHYQIIENVSILNFDGRCHGNGLVFSRKIKDPYLIP